MPQPNTATQTVICSVKRCAFGMQQADSVLKAPATVFGRECPTPRRHNLDANLAPFRFHRAQTANRVSGRFIMGAMKFVQCTAVT